MLVFLVFTLASTFSPNAAQISRALRECSETRLLKPEEIFTLKDMTTFCNRILFFAAPNVQISLTCKLRNFLPNKSNCTSTSVLVVDITDGKTEKSEEYFFCPQVTHKDVNTGLDLLLTRNISSTHALGVTLLSREPRKALEFCTVTTSPIHRLKPLFTQQDRDLVGRDEVEENLDSRCGIINEERILGGREASPHSYPWMVPLTIDSSKLCGGSILNAWFVLTAAHCVHGSSRVRLHLGVHNLADRDIYRDSVNVISHPKYHFPNYDIALVQVSVPIVFSRSVRPVCLPKRNVENGEKLVALGWGKTSDTSKSSQVLKVNSFTVIPDGDCRAIYRYNFDSSVMCTKDIIGQSACQGDSGSSAGIVESGTFYQLAVISFTASNSCNQSLPVGYTEIYPFLDWITKIIN